MCCFPRAVCSFNAVVILLIGLLVIDVLLFFTTVNLIIFYVCFEMVLPLMLLLIVGFGCSPERTLASLYLLLYTTCFSLPMLYVVLTLSYSGFSLCLPIDLLTFSPLFFLLGGVPMMVKYPLYFLHLWLPRAHVESPVVGSVILAAVLLKIGSYGLFRLCMLFPHVGIHCFTLVVSLVALSLSCMVLLCVSDVKSLIAYSSVCHITLLFLGMSSHFTVSTSSAVVLMVSHAFISRLLFHLANCLYTFSSTRLS